VALGDVRRPEVGAQVHPRRHAAPEGHRIPEDHRLHAGAPQVCGRRQAVGSGADDRDVRLAHVLEAPFHCEVGNQQAFDEAGQRIVAREDGLGVDAAQRPHVVA